jgi:hypothetical protein
LSWDERLALGLSTAQLCGECWLATLQAVRKLSRRRRPAVAFAVLYIGLFWHEVHNLVLRAILIALAMAYLAESLLPDEED